MPLQCALRAHRPLLMPQAHHVSEHSDFQSDSPMKKIFALILTVLALACCNKPEEGFKYQTKLVDRVYLPSDISVTADEEYVFQGRGFQVGDIFVFEGADTRFEIPVVSVTTASATIIVTSELARGDYMLYVRRGSDVQKIGRITVWLSSSFIIPDKEGYNVKGIVFCGDKGLGGVVVSDGDEVTVTNSNGFYWLSSKKEHGYVFCTLPSGYMPAFGSNLPAGYWGLLKKDVTETETCNFELREEPNTNHRIIYAADIHLSNRDFFNGDFSQFKAGFWKDMEGYAADSSVPTYTIFLGDQTWDQYWYSYKFGPKQFKEYMKEFPLMSFLTPGNHDNDPWVVGDLPAEVSYKYYLGPTYSSVNIGDVHYVFLDNVRKINNGAAEGVVGDRSYDKILTETQLEWLKKDLSYVPKDKPLVVCVHCQLHTTFTERFDHPSASASTSQILSAVAEFENVHIMSGHTHVNSTMVVSDRVIEHNVAAVCETWWLAGHYSERGVCVDGSPAGYSVWDVEGSSLKWRFRGSGREASEQFRSYDMNVVKPIIAAGASYLNQQTDPVRDTAGDDYKDLGANVVYINVWDYDPLWKIEVSEGGSPLKVTQVYERDPLHTICYDIPRVKNDLGSITGQNSSIRNSHIFKVTASSATTTLDIKVTNRFGEVFTEQMVRPKEFNAKTKTIILNN